MSLWNLKGATVSIGGVVVSNAVGETSKHDFESLKITKKQEVRETYNAANTPRPAREQLYEDIEGEVSLQYNSAADFPDTSTSVALVIDGDGIYFSGNVRIDDVSCEAGSEKDAIAKGSFKFTTIDDSYIFSNTSGA